MKLLHDIKEHMTIRKIIGLILWLACMIFLLVHASVIRRSFEYYNGSVAKQLDKEIVVEQAADHEHQTSLIGSQRIEQPFTAQADLLSIVAVSIENPETNKTTGTIKVSIEDDQNEEIASVSLPAGMAENNDFTLFSFKGDTKQLNQNEIVSREVTDRTEEGVKLSKNKTYKLVVQSEDIQSTDKVAVNGNAANGDAILNVITFVKYQYPIAVFFLLLMIITLIMIVWPEKPLRSDIAQWIIFALTPFVGCAIMFGVAGMEMTDILVRLLHLDGAANVLLVFLIEWILLTLTNRLGLSAGLTTCFVFVFAIMNYLLIAARGAPLAFNDLSVWKTAAGVAKSYSLTIDKFTLWGIILTAFWICMILAFEETRGCKTWRQRVLALLASCVLFGGTWNLFKGEHVGDNIYFSDWNPTKSYQEHGYLLGFTMSIKKSFLQTPKGYSADKVKSITDQYQSDEAEEVTEPTTSTPNLIVIMNESYADLSSIGDLHTNEDVVPFYHSLKENTIKGTMHTSILGGHTADTEYEFLTGNSMELMPVKAVPFRNKINDKTSSLAWNMVDQNYAGNIAFHPGAHDSFGRNIAYPNLGFEEYISLEDIEDYELIRDYMSDKSDYEVVQKLYEESRKKTEKPFFLFNVTIQNHGGYTLSDGVVEGGGIEYVGSSQYDEDLLQYLNLIKISDNELEKLVDYFKKVEEPTVIVFFGDHQPALSLYVCEASFGKPYDEWSLEEKETQYRVPFFIWANYDIEEESDVEISANYLRAYMTQKLGGKMTGYDKYLMDLRESIPILTDICYYDSQGEIHDYATETDLNKDIQQYEWLQYSSMFDKKNRKNAFYYLK